MKQSFILQVNPLTLERPAGLIGPFQRNISLYFKNFKTYILSIKHLKDPLYRKYKRYNRAFAKKIGSGPRRPGWSTTLNIFVGLSRVKNKAFILSKII